MDLAFLDTEKELLQLEIEFLAEKLAMYKTKLNVVNNLIAEEENRLANEE